MRIDGRHGRRASRLLAGLACAAAVAVTAPGAAQAAPAPPPNATGPAPGQQASDEQAARAQAAAEQDAGQAAPPTSAGNGAAASQAASQAAAAQAAAQRAAAARASAARAAARAAARTAVAAQRDQVAWTSHGRPTTMVIVRQTGIDLVDRGRLTRRVPRFGPTVTITSLSQVLPRSALTIVGDTARLSAAVVITPNVTLDVGAPVTKLILDGGSTAPDAASIYTGSGGLTLRGVTVSAVDHTSGQALTPGPGRPFIFVSPDGRFTATDTTINGLGTAPSDSDDSPTAQQHPGVDFRDGSTGSLTRTSLVGGGTGLRLDGSRDVHLENVTVSGSAGAGLVLHGDRGTTLSGVHAEHNGTFGVQVTGPSTDRPVTGVSATGNGTFGIGVDKQTGLKISGVTVASDGTGGVDVQQSGNVTLTGVTATDEPVGIFTHVNSTNVVIDQLTSTGGRRGVMVEKTTNHLTLQRSTVTGASVAGVAVGGTDVELGDVSVADSRTGLRVERGAHGVTATRLTLSGGLDGVVASAGTSGVVLQDATIQRVTDDGVRSSSPDARIVGGRIISATTGIDVDAGTTISDVSIGLVDQGIRTQSPVLVHANDIDVEAISVGVNAEDGSPFLLSGSRVHALESVRGTLTTQGVNDLSLPPVRLLSAIGLPLIVLALALQAFAAWRSRRHGGDLRRTPPARVTPASAESSPVDAVEVGSRHHAHA